MKQIFIVIFIVILQYTLFGQVGQQDSVEFHIWSDSRFAIDSLYENDTIKLRHIYYSNPEIYSSKQTITTEIIQNSQLKGRGGIGISSDNYIGEWTFWDKEGNVILESIYAFKDEDTRYINQWSRDGSQNLKNGEGLYIVSQMLGKDFDDFYVGGYPPRDSIVYEVKDSLKNGNYSSWVKTEEGRVYKYRNGSYKNNKKEGAFLGYYENGTSSVHGFYREGEKDGFWIQWYENGKYSSYGFYKDGKSVGTHIDWDKNGNLRQTLSYDENWKQHLTIYHPNGKINYTGFHDTTVVIDTIPVINLAPETDSRGVYYYELTKSTRSVKDGDWYYYDQDGILKEIKRYKKGELIEE